MTEQRLVPPAEEDGAEPPPEPPKRRKGKKKKKVEKEDREEIFDALVKLGHEPHYQVLDGRDHLATHHVSHGQLRAADVDSQDRALAPLWHGPYLPETCASYRVAVL